MKRPKFTCENIYDVIRPVQNVSKIFGMTCFSYMETPGTLERRAFIAIHDWIFFDVALIVDIILWIYFFVWYRSSFQYSESMIFNYWLPLVFIITFLSSVVNITWTTLNWKKHSKVLNLLQQIDEKMMEYGSPINYKFHKLVMLIWMAIIFTFTFCITIYTVNDPIMLNFYQDMDWHILTPLLVMFPYVCIMAQFFFYIIGVELRLSKLNKLISTYFYVHKPSTNPEPANEEFRIKIIHDISILHDKVVDSIQIINYCYGFPVMLGFAASFFDIVFSVFCVFSSYFKPELVSVPVVLEWIIFYGINLGLVMYGGQMVKNEGLKTVSLVHKAMNFETDGKLIDKFSKMSQQLVHRVPRFSSGLFTFDMILFHSIISAAVLYVTILIQFEISSDSFKQMFNQTQSCNQSSA